MSKRLLLNITILAIGILLGTMLKPFSLLPTSAQANCQTFPETGKTVCGGFLTYWKTHGGLAQQGYPISNELQEKSDLNGQTYTMQYFERAVFEYHPENQPPNDILLSQLGTFRYKAKYPGGGSGAPPPPAGPPPVGMDTDITIRDGVTIRLITGDWPPGPTGFSCGGVMNWTLRITNKSTTPYNTIMDKSSASQIDSTGKQYRLSESDMACALPFSDLFANPGTIGANGGVADGSIRFAEAPAPSATYLDLHFTLSGTPLAFRYSLR